VPARASPDAEGGVLVGGLGVARGGRGRVANRIDGHGTKLGHQGVYGGNSGLTGHGQDFSLGKVFKPKRDQTRLNNRSHHRLMTKGR
jgi:hypothetical protein